MTDLSLEWGSDLSIGPNGDLVVVDGQGLSNQRILRRLLTNGGDYLWNLNYGAGLGSFVGSPLNEQLISAVIKSQLASETSVSSNPAPSVSISFVNSLTNSFSTTITYAEATTGQASGLTFSTGT